MEEILALLLASPTVRAEMDKAVVALGEIIVREVNDLFFKSDSDPAFRTQYLAVSSELVNCKTLEEKQNVLKKLAAIRAGTSQ